jgi:hypothetical protein
MVLACWVGGCASISDGLGSPPDGGPGSIDTPVPGDARVPDDGGPPGRAITYVLLTHPYFEITAWGLIDAMPDDFRVLVTLTQGEQVSACNVDTGPPQFQGPGSPVGQPDLGEELHAAQPWQGRWTAACAEARMASWHAFLDEMARGDSTLPLEPAFVRRVCFAGNTDDGTPPRRADGSPAVDHLASCADVWVGEQGARIAFDLGDGDLTTAEVMWAFRSVRENEALLGLPALPTRTVIGAGLYNVDDPARGTLANPDCDVTGHSDVRAIHEAVTGQDLGVGTQWMRACETDPAVAATGGRIETIPDATYARAMALDPTTMRRQGVAQRAYGWLVSGGLKTCVAGCQFGQRQAFTRH